MTPKPKNLLKYPQNLENDRNTLKTKNDQNTLETLKKTEIHPKTSKIPLNLENDRNDPET